MEREGYSTISEGSISFLTPRPLHNLHAPNGLLNENILGESSSKLTLQSVQVKFSENVSTSPESIFSVRTIPSLCLSEISMSSASLFFISGEAFSLSTTISMLCFLFLSRFKTGFSDRSYSSPSTFTLKNPSFFIDSKTFWYSPLRPLTTGESMINFVSFGISIIRSTIWSTDCFVTGFPHIWQKGVPILA